MNGSDPLAQLRDIHLPAPVGWWPPAPGWWILAFVVLILLAGGMFFLIRKYLRSRYRREARAALNLIPIDDRKEMPAALEKVSVLLRRVAIQTYGRQSVSSLTGSAWLEFLDRTGNTSCFSQGEARVLGTEMYRPGAEADLNEVIRCAEKWIQEHRS